MTEQRVQPKRDSDDRKRLQRERDSDNRDVQPRHDSDLGASVTGSQSGAASKIGCCSS